MDDSESSNSPDSWHDMISTPLRPMEVCNKVCDMIGCKQTAYYKHYRVFLKFRSYGSRPNSLRGIPEVILEELIRRRVLTLPAKHDIPDELIDQFVKDEEFIPD